MPAYSEKREATRESLSESLFSSCSELGIDSWALSEVLTPRILFGLKEKTGVRVPARVVRVLVCGLVDGFCVCAMGKGMVAVGERNGCVCGEIEIICHVA